MRRQRRPCAARWVVRYDAFDDRSALFPGAAGRAKKGSDHLDGWKVRDPYVPRPLQRAPLTLSKEETEAIARATEAQG